MPVRLFARYRGSKRAWWWDHFRDMETAKVHVANVRRNLSFVCLEEISAEQLTEPVPRGGHLPSAGARIFNARTGKLATPEEVAAPEGAASPRA